MFATILRPARLLSLLYRFIVNCSPALLTFSPLTVALAVQNDKDIPVLEQGKPVERELSGGQSHSYRIALASGQYIHVLVDQRGIDVVVTLFAPDGKQIVEVDSPNGIQGPEPLSAIADVSGTYRLEVRSFEKSVPTGRYEAKLEELRAEVEQDKSRVAAERAFLQAQLLVGQGTRESLQSAIKKYEVALPLYHIAGDAGSEVKTLNSLGLIYDRLGEKQKALDYFMKALPLLSVISDSSPKAVTFANIGAVYYSTGEQTKALGYLNQALPLFRALGDQRGEARVLTSIGQVNNELGETRVALDYFLKALPLLLAARDSIGVAVTLINIGNNYQDLGEQQKALVYFSQALPLIQAVGDQRVEAVTLAHIGFVYHSLGEEQKALDYFNQALTRSRSVVDRGNEARVLAGLGEISEALGEQQKALEYFNQALAQMRAVGDRSGEAGTLSSIGRVYDSTGEKQKALDYYVRALHIRREVGDRRGEAVTLTNIGVVYYSLGEQQKALGYFNQALPQMRAVGDRSNEAGTLSNLMSVYRSLNNPRLAIFYGKRSVNDYQQLRANMRNLDKEVQKTYLRSVEQAYRELTELLISQDRSAEAQQLLNAFKDQQFFDFDQAQAIQLKPLTPTRHEAEFALDYEKTGDGLGTIGSQVLTLKRRIGNRQPTSEEAKQLQLLIARLGVAADEFSALLKQAEIEFSKPIDEKDRIGDVSDTMQMQAMLRQLSRESGQKAVAVYTLAGREALHALVITVDGITSASAPIKGDELNNKARQLWGLLQSADYDPTKLSNELYNVIFRPIEDKLPKDTKTILWSLDGNLRYLPMAALYDGKQYLVERFNHVVFTRAEQERLTRAVSRTWTGYGFAASAPHTIELNGKSMTFGPLDFVKDEMQIFRTKIYPAGIISGEVFREAQFTKASLLATLKQPRPLVHISSHFRFRPGDATNSFLLLGDGQVMTLAEMKEQANLFQGVELLTLSACDTAAQRPYATGREIDAFAELAQRLGANAVIASLWAVLDRSTSQLMKGFYRNRERGKLSKAEALRTAQVELLYGKSREPPAIANQGNASVGGSSFAEGEIIVEAKYRRPFTTDKNRPFAHPYFWSPFILFGNWR